MKIFAFYSALLFLTFWSVSASAVVPSATPYSAVSIPADESQCVSVDWSDQSGPVKDQDNDNDCYAYAAVELMNFPEHGTAPGESVPISAFATAITNGRVNPNQGGYAGSPQDEAVSGMNGGNTGNAIRAVRKYGACLESNVKSYAQQSTVFKNLYLRFKNQSEWSSLPEEERKIFSTLSDSQTVSRSRTFESYIQSLVQQACASRITKNLPTWGERVAEFPVTGPRDQVRALSYIHQTIDVGYPAGVGIKNDLIQKVRPGETPVAHSTVVMGRRFFLEAKNGPGCYFLIKNSWGEAWPSAHEFDQMLPMADVSKPGYFWVKDADLAAKLSSFTYIAIKK